MLVRPLVPDVDIMINEVPNVGTALQEPQEFVCNFVKGQLLGCHEREADSEIESQLFPHATDRTGPGAVGAQNAFGLDFPKAVQILPQCGHLLKLCR